MCLSSRIAPHLQMHMLIGHILDTTTSVVQELLPLSTMVATYATYVS